MRLLRPFDGRGGSSAEDAYGATDTTEIIWALKDISFEVEPGEVVGVIGRNGAGKTTLLRILSRITEPTEGSAKVRGRVAALLNVGTGFHPELTGRDNIYLNGAILGMGKAEINRKFDEIVAFSEVEKFIDTPVKRYSSGMQLRLAFAVAAHLEPDILVVDEVLAVGDHAFQQKCLGKMENVAGQGRTVLYVSHRLDTVAALCSRCILLENGRISTDGDTRAVIDTYYASLTEAETPTLGERTDREGRGRFRFVDSWLEDEYGKRVQTVVPGRLVKFVLLYENTTSEQLRDLSAGIAIWTPGNLFVTGLGTDNLDQQINLEGGRSGRLECIVPKWSLNIGKYYYNLMARSSRTGAEIEDHVQQAGVFSVDYGDYYGRGRAPGGFMMMDYQFRISQG